jgi:tetratricopeptide (TPR) repeat protein
MEKRQEISESEVENLLRDMVLKEVPVDLTDRIMREITAKQPGLLQQFWHRFNKTIIVPVKPSYAFCLFILIFGSFMLGRGFHPLPEEPATTLSVDGTFQAETAQAAYLIGRGLLAAEQTNKALGLLRKAATFEPNNPEYAYWEGIGYWKNGNRQQERSSYIRGLTSEPESIPLLVNLGHNYLSDNLYQQALETYQAVLDLAPAEPVARYNSGLIYRKLNQGENEAGAWKNYLQYHRTGKHAFRAVERLNTHGDFSYRPYRVGARKLILSPPLFFNDSLPDQLRKNELTAVTKILAANRDLKLNVVVFLKNDKALARKKALEIKAMIAELGGQEIGGRVALSWFDSPEIVKTTDTTDTTDIEIAESLMLFSSFIKNKNEEVAI